VKDAIGLLTDTGRRNFSVLEDQWKHFAHLRPFLLSSLHLSLVPNGGQLKGLNLERRFYGK